LLLNGNPNFGGTVQGSGSTQPTNYQVTLNGNATLGRLVNRLDPIQLPAVAAPPANDTQQQAESRNDSETLPVPTPHRS
jgi:hypothetical protein